MNPETLRAQQARIEEQIKSECIDLTDQSAPVLDGPVNVEKYTSARIKILWVLKEPYCDGNERKGGGWSLAKLLDEETDRMASQRTFQPICYVNYGILKGQTDWDRMPWLRDSSEIRETLKEIAFINICKLPGLRWTPLEVLRSSYQRNRKLIMNQIETYRPGIVFAAGPHGAWIGEDWGFKQSDWEQFGSASALSVGQGRRLVWIHHPAQRKAGLGRRRYVNEAILAATKQNSVIAA